MDDSDSDDEEEDEEASDCETEDEEEKDLSCGLANLVQTCNSDNLVPEIGHEAFAVMTSDIDSVVVQDRCIHNVVGCVRKDNSVCSFDSVLQRRSSNKKSRMSVVPEENSTVDFHKNFKTVLNHWPLLVS